MTGFFLTWENTTVELMKRLTEINGFICEARGRLEELEGDCQSYDSYPEKYVLNAQAEFLWDWLTRLEPIETEIDEFTEEWRKTQERKTA